MPSRTGTSGRSRIMAETHRRKEAEQWYRDEPWSWAGGQMGVGLLSDLTFSLCLFLCVQIQTIGHGRVHTHAHACTLPSLYLEYQVATIGVQMTGSVGSQGSDPQCTFLSISSRKPKIRPHHLLFEKEHSSSGTDSLPLWWCTRLRG